jgi:hypothetical protein
MVETIALCALSVVPLPLLCVAWVWSFRARQSLHPWRRIPFLCGLAAATIAYVAQFIVLRYWDRYWTEGTILLVVQLMLIAALAGFATSLLGRGYGRISSCSASVLVFATWWLKGSP